MAGIAPSGQLIALGLEQRAEPDEEWGHGWYFRPGEWEFGPFFPGLWRWAIALKCAVCILFGWKSSQKFNQDWIMVAAWDGERCNGYPEADYHQWKQLLVRKGWRPSTWRYDAGTEST